MTRREWLVAIDEILIENERMKKDIEFLLCNWFHTLEDEGGDPWENGDLILWAEKYEYTKEKHRKLSEELC